MTPGQIIRDILARARDLRLQGQAPTAEELCRDHPELLEDVRRELARPDPVETSPPAAPPQEVEEPETLPPGELSPAFSRHPARIGPYDVLGVLGEGGMGVVYRARNRESGRLVALKLMREVAPHPGLLARFQREANVLARLCHPNIVHLLLAGQHGGQPFLVMELVEGGNLEQQMRDKTCTPVEAANQIEILARAVHVAHQAGIIHRDLKPGNVLLSEDGTLKVTDFGLAKVLEGEHKQTTTGAVLGTPAYMSPEQACGQVNQISPATDVWALGVVLYEMLTRQLPFRGTNSFETLQLVCSADPPSPHSINPSVPRDLETICLKCLEKDPARRYQSAKELADDLLRYVGRSAIVARRRGSLGKLTKWVKSNPVVTLAAVAMLLAACVAGFFAYQHDLSRRRHREELRRIAMEMAVVAAMSTDFDRAKEYLAEAMEHGAKKEEEHFLRGQIALYQGRLDEALTHLNKAAELAPDWPAAQAVLLRAYHDAGQYDEFYIRSNHLKELQPRTAEDYLYMGQLAAYASPESALPLLDEAIKRRNTPLARLVHAEVRTNMAQDSGSLDDTSAALKDAATARASLPGNPIALTISLEAQLVAATTYKRHGMQDKREQALKQAAVDAEELKAFPTVPKAVLMRTRYFDLIGDDAGLRAEYLRDLAAPKAAASAGRAYFFLLYRQGRFDEALKTLEEMKHTGNELMYRLRRAFVLANLPSGTMRAKEEYHAALEGGKKAHPFGRMVYAHMIPLLLGDRPNAVGTFRKLNESKVVEERFRWPRIQVRYMAGAIDADQFLVLAGPSLFQQCEAHFYIGMRHLADGDRTGAGSHFKKCVDTGVFNFLEHEWSRAFLARMEADENWPAWIERKK